MTAATRWDRLTADLAAAGVDVKVDERPYAEAVYGRVTHGVSRTITIRRPGRGVVTISDVYARRNASKWLGWHVVAENADSIIERSFRWTTKRSDVVAQIVEVTA